MHNRREVFGILACFLNHLYWLWPIISPMEARYGHNVMFPQYYGSVAVLALYWIIFRTSYVVRTVNDRELEGVSAVAALLNSFLLLGILYYQSMHQQIIAFYALLTLGTAELVLGQLPRIRRRRSAFLILTTLGASLIIGAVPVRFSGSVRCASCAS